MAELLPVASPSSSTFLDMDLLAGQVAPSSLAMYRRDFLAYMTYAQTPERALESSTLARWRNSLVQETQLSPNTINRMMSAIRKLMDQAAQQGYITHEVSDSFRHIDGVKPGAMKERLRPHNRVRIEPEQVREISERIDRSTLIGKRNAALFLTFASSGMRLGELSILKEEQIRASGRGYLLTLYAVSGKNQKEDQDAYISVEAVEAIHVWLAARPVASSYIFTSFGGRGDSRLLEKPMSHTGVWYVIKDIFKDYGLKFAKPHDLRRFVGTQLARRNVATAKQALRHKKAQTTIDHYVLEEFIAGETDDLF